MKKLLFSACISVLASIIVSLNGQTPIKIGGGEHFNNVTISTSSTQNEEVGSNTLNGHGMAPNLVAASRFLGHATLGADYETIVALSNSSFSDWIDAQQAMPVSFLLKDNVEQLNQMAIDSMTFYGTDMSNFQMRYRHFAAAWTKYMVESPDILRSRVALALSEIFVLSSYPDFDDEPRMIADYYDIFLRNAFGNYRTILEEVTYHPGMGQYLTSLNNPKSNPAQNLFPDENYAREIMQLFSIGLFELNQDGTPVLDANGNPIETYDSNDIVELAKVFTGLSWGDALFFGINNAPTDDSKVTPMVMFNDEHESGAKTLLNGLNIPDRNPVDGDADIADALDFFYNHPNTAPFISFRLIQRLIKSNPSPEYVERISNVFSDNGAGIRGDIGAVVKAILLDQEARDCAMVNQPYQGMLREPMVRHTQLIRAFNASVPNGSGIYRDDMDRMLAGIGQRPMTAPSVFNFFTTDFQPIGPVEQANLVAPEFQLLDSRTIIEYGSLLNRWLEDDDEVMEYSSLFDDEIYHLDKEAYLDLSDELALAGDADIYRLVERLNLILAHGQLKETTRANIVDKIKQVPENQPEFRVRIAMFLVMYSPDYMIIK